MSNTQYFNWPCCIPPCPDCGAKPTTSKTANTRVVHDAACPLRRGVTLARVLDRAWFARLPHMAERIRLLTDAELAELSWLEGCPQPSPARVLVRRGDDRHALITEPSH